MRDFADVGMRNSLIQQKQITETLCIVLFMFFLFWAPYIVYSMSLVFCGETCVHVIFNPIVSVRIRLIEKIGKKEESMRGRKEWYEGRGCEKDEGNVVRRTRMGECGKEREDVRGRKERRKSMKERK